MESFFRNHMIEEGDRNIILQNRCGNRCTLLFFPDHAEAEFLYKPNAFRRKDYRARNFSNRDVYTTLFSQFSFPDLELAHLSAFDYDPFITRLSTHTPSLARNAITVVNVADENMFAIAARTPLLLGIKPRGAFEEHDGLLIDRFCDRGEEIVSFVAFTGYEANRYRVLDNGTYVLQIFENELVYIGGEENEFQMKRALGVVAGMGLDALIRRNEEVVAPALASGRIVCTDSDFQKVIDLNRRIVYSGMDEGGACYGALNRIYMLIWIRDGSMTTSLMARAGNPDFVRTFAPFLLKNPSVTVSDTGEQMRQYQQILGSRWTKNEDDGIFYAVLAMYSHFVATGDDSLIWLPEFVQLLQTIDGFLEKAWEADVQLVGSDTRGESPLLSNPYFGYDVVNGSLERGAPHGWVIPDGKKIMSRSYSLYNMVNTYNMLCMAQVLLKQRPDLGGNGQEQKYAEIATAVRTSLRTKFVDPSGYLYAEFMKYNDGSAQWVSYGEGVDYWEYAWATSLGPFFPALDVQLRTAAMVKKRWPEILNYGFCPWNIVAAMLREHGMDTSAYQEMLRPEIEDALVCAQKYPMRGALGEYLGYVNNVSSSKSWRALPFTAGSLAYSLTGTIIKALPMGLAVRAGTFVASVQGFRNQISRIDATAEGEGDTVGSWRINGETVDGTLQIPQALLRAGANAIVIQRAALFCGCRVYASNAVLVQALRTGGRIELLFDAPVALELTVENYSSAGFLVRTVTGDVIPRVTVLPGTNLTALETDSCGNVTIIITVTK